MSKFLTPDKLKLYATNSSLLVCLLFTNANAYSAEMKQNQNEIEQSKTLLIGGNRKAAIDLLDKYIAKTKNSKSSSALTEKRKLYLEQFITNQAFQSYQEARLLLEVERFSDCIKEIDKIPLADQDNIDVLEVKAKCFIGQKLYIDAEKILKQMLLSDVANESAYLELIDLYILMGQTEQAFELIQKSANVSIKDQEKFTILKSKYFINTNRVKEAIDVLRADQEKNLDHIYINYELGMIYYKKTNSDWMTRKYLSLFVSRTKKLSVEELKTKGWDPLVKQSQEILDELEKKLGL